MYMGCQIVPNIILDKVDSFASGQSYEISISFCCGSVLVLDIAKNDQLCVVLPILGPYNMQMFLLAPTSDPLSRLMILKIMSPLLVNYLSSSVTKLLDVLD